MRFGNVCRVALVAAGLLLSPSPSAAGPVVVELFTSQGCSACPPADALLGDLAERPDVIPLGLHVDYWDYLGWRDRFAAPANGRRQRGYIERMRHRTVFTPQIIVDGVTSVIGSRRQAVLEEIALAAAMGDGVAVRATRDGDAIRVELEPQVEASLGVARVLYFIYEWPRTVHITRGENETRRITYHNVVRDWMTLGHWSGEAAVMQAPRPEDARGVAVIVQRDDGVVLGAGKLEFDHAPVSAVPASD